MTRVAVAGMAGAVGAALALAVPAAAQEGRIWVGPSPAWLGLSYEVEWLAREGACEPRVVIESVIEGAPADRAGLRPGDALLSMNGLPVGGTQLQLLASRLSPGDSVRLEVRREGRLRELVAVADRRPDRPPVALRSARDGLTATNAPVLRLRGDTLIARNLEAGDALRGRGYWLAEDDRRAEYRRVDRFSSDPVDRRVVELVRCAERVREAAPVMVMARRMSVEEIQEKADSMREVLIRRVLTRPEGERERTIEAVRVTEAPPAPGAPVAAGAPSPAAPTVVRIHPDGGVYTVRVGDHVAAAARGVAGAEVAAMEPELAAYFRGVRDGLLVLRVAPGTPAARAGLQPGDVITAGGGRELASVEDLRRLLSLPDATPVELRVVRHGRDRTVTLQRD